MNTIIKGVHLCSTEVNRVNEFVYESFVRHDFVLQILLAKKDFRLDLYRATSGFLLIQGLLKGSHYGRVA
jgi:hypothetical protein